MWGWCCLNTHLSHSALWQQYCWEEWESSSPRSHTNTERCPRSSHAHCSSTARNVSYSEKKKKKREEEGIKTSHQKGFHCQWLIRAVKYAPASETTNPTLAHGSGSQKSWLSPVRAAYRQERRAKAALKRSGFYLLHLDRQIFWKQGFKLILTK